MFFVPDILTLELVNGVGKSNVKTYSNALVLGNVYAQLTFTSAPALQRGLGFVNTIYEA
jgi:hypothetical protein